MTVLFGRSVLVDIGFAGETGRRIDGLRVAFRAKKSSTSKADASDVTVYNPAEGTIRALEQKGILTRVLAGYGGRPSQVAMGTVVKGSLRISTDGVDRIARWQVHDGGADLGLVYLSRAWNGEIKTSALLDYVVAQSGLSTGTVILGREIGYQRFAAQGTVREVLDTVVADAESVYAIQDGRLQVWPKGSGRPRRAEVLRVSTGLIGSPKSTDAGIESTALLRPGLRPGDTYRLVSAMYDGDLVALDVSHEGDSGEDVPFYTTTVGRPA